MDKSASWTVVKAAISATTTGVWGILKGHEHYGVLATAAALNSGITAGAFFSMREYIIGPILVHTMPFEQYERRRRELRIGQESSEARDMSASSSQFSYLRSHKLLDTALSGVTVGGIVRGLRSGPKAAVSGAITVGVAATLLQLGYNEVQVQRLKMISRRRSMTPSPVSAEPQPVFTPAASEPVAPLEQESTSWKAKALSILGVKRLSEDEYLERLKLQREHHLLRIAELERKLEEEEREKENGKDS
ncbi:hypothetical protein NP233_g6179 [Leucocoprinus birnbaumii]|uniref:Uncharacterized protein n=1 Tax=Leucocoprinus birnbaumii TaxID=56174 RepID=A0AAD5YW05_9AGAR|nr:hypothetical protein NP233_g6179 [Leucocoprinus birnbaumii]